MKRHFYFFDFARVIAAFLVLLVHARVEILTPYSLLPAENQTLLAKAFFAICSLGTDGVIVFFILSGFLVGGRNIEKLINGQGDAKSFAINRLSRIFPPLIAALLLSTIQKLITGDVIDVAKLIGNLFCMQNIAVDPEMPVLWTIAYEALFYMGIFSLFLLNKKQSVTWGVLILGLAVSLALQVRPYFWIPLLFGSLFYFIKNQIQGKKYLMGVSLILGFVAVLGEKLSNDSSAIRIFPSTFPYESVICLESLCLSVVLVCLSMSYPENYIAKRIEEFGSKYAKYSYSLFLSHYPILKLSHYCIGRSLGINMEGILSFALVCALCLVMAYFFYTLTERHTKKIEKIIKRILC